MRTPNFPLSVCLPLPPSMNRYWPIRVHNFKPIKALSPEARAFKDTVRTLLLPETSGRVPSAERLGVSVHVHFKDKRRQDLDNRLKGLLDAMEGHIYRRDEQIDEIRVYRGVKVKVGAVIVSLWVKDAKPEPLPERLAESFEYGVLSQTLIGRLA